MKFSAVKTSIKFNNKHIEAHKRIYIIKIMKLIFQNLIGYELNNMIYLFINKSYILK